MAKKYFDNIPAVDAKALNTSLGVPVNVKHYGAVGDGVTDDTAAIQAAIDATSIGGGVCLIPPGVFVKQTDIYIKSNVKLVGSGSNSVLSGIGNIIIKGTASGNSSNISANAVRGDKTISVVDGSQFAIGAKIEILASVNEDDNSTKEIPGEINEIVSINTTELTLKHPLSHDYTIGFATEPTITVIESFVENAEVSQVNVSEGGLDLTYCENINLDVQLSGFVKTSGAVRKLYGRITVTDNIGTGAFALADLNRLSDFYLNINVYGGSKDGIRLYGCADGVLEHPFVSEVPNRDIWMYKSNDIKVNSPTIVGSQTVAENIEILLFDNCNGCTVSNPFIKEINKSGLVDVIEFRANSRNCKVQGGLIYYYGSVATTVKSSSSGSFLDSITFIAETSGESFVCKIDTDTTTSLNATLHIQNCKIKRGILSTGVNILRTSTSDTFDVDYDLIEINGNTIERGIGALVAISGTQSGSSIKRLNIVNNNAIKGSSTSGTLFYVQGIPVSNLFASNNYDNTNNRKISLYNSMVQKAILSNNSCGGYSLTVGDWALVNGTGSEAASAETPQKSWPIGSMIKFTDSGDGSGDGTYLKQTDENWLRVV